MRHGGNLLACGAKAIFILVVSLLWQTCSGQSAASPADQATLDLLLQQALARSYQLLTPDPPDYPVFTDEDGIWVCEGSWYWSSGFFPGELWLARGLSGDSGWNSRAQSWTAGVEAEKYDDTTHDVGYKIGPAYMNGWRFTGNANYAAVLLTAAGSMASLWSPTVGCLRSQDNGWPAKFMVEIDNVPTLELLFWAARNGGQAAWRDMAASHAVRTAQEFIRPDGGSYHVVYFSPTSGTVLSKGTLQGYRDWSTWARGHAWGVYGFPMCYRETGDVRLLAAARTMADYYLARLPADLVPPWDFDVPDPAGAPKDSSAAAIVAAGLFDLCRLTDTVADRQRYWDAACAMLASLCSPTYLSDGVLSEGILLHGTYNHVTGTGVDASQIWGDYYLLQAIERYRYQSSLMDACRTATTDWQNIPMPVRRGRYQVLLDATPSASNLGAVVSLSAGQAGAHGNCAVQVRFNTSGRIDARDGGSFRAGAVLAYAAGSTYRVRLDVDVPSRRYSVYVAPPSGSEVALASDYAFRTEQAAAAWLDNCALVTSAGSLEVCNLRLAPYQADFSGDGLVDITDLLIFAGSWATRSGEPGYDPVVDLSGDGAIDVEDLLTFADDWGRCY